MKKHGFLKTVLRNSIKIVEFVFVVSVLLVIIRKNDVSQSGATMTFQEKSS